MGNSPFKTQQQGTPSSSTNTAGTGSSKKIKREVEKSTLTTSLLHKHLDTEVEVEIKDVKMMKVEKDDDDCNNFVRNDTNHDICNTINDTRFIQSTSIDDDRVEAPIIPSSLPSSPLPSIITSLVQRTTPKSPQQQILLPLEQQQQQQEEVPIQVSSYVLPPSFVSSTNNGDGRKKWNDMIGKRCIMYFKEYNDFFGRTYTVNGMSTTGTTSSSNNNNTSTSNSNTGSDYNNPSNHWYMGTIHACNNGKYNDDTTDANADDKEDDVVQPVSFTVQLDDTIEYPDVPMNYIYLLVSGKELISTTTTTTSMIGTFIENDEYKLYPIDWDGNIVRCLNHPNSTNDDNDNDDRSIVVKQQELTPNHEQQQQQQQQQEQIIKWYCDIKPTTLYIGDIVYVYFQMGNQHVYIRRLRQQQQQQQHNNNIDEPIRYNAWYRGRIYKLYTKHVVVDDTHSNSNNNNKGENVVTYYYADVIYDDGEMEEKIPYNCITTNASSTVTTTTSTSSTLVSSSSSSIFLDPSILIPPPISNIILLQRGYENIQWLYNLPMILPKTTIGDIDIDDNTNISKQRKIQPQRRQNKKLKKQSSDIICYLKPPPPQQQQQQQLDNSNNTHDDFILQVSYTMIKNIKNKNPVVTQYYTCSYIQIVQAIIVYEIFYKSLISGNIHVTQDWPIIIGTDGINNNDISTTMDPNGSKNDTKQKSITSTKTTRNTLQKKGKSNSNSKISSTTTLSTIPENKTIAVSRSTRGKQPIKYNDYVQDEDEEEEEVIVPRRSTKRTVTTQKNHNDDNDDEDDDVILPTPRRTPSRLPKMKKNVIDDDKDNIDDDDDDDDDDDKVVSPRCTPNRLAKIKKNVIDEDATDDDDDDDDDIVITPRRTANRLAKNKKKVIDDDDDGSDANDDNDIVHPLRRTSKRSKSNTKLPSTSSHNLDKKRKSTSTSSTQSKSTTNQTQNVLSIVQTKGARQMNVKSQKQTLKTGQSDVENFDTTSKKKRIIEQEEDVTAILETNWDWSTTTSTFTTTAVSSTPPPSSLFSDNKQVPLAKGNSKIVVMDNSIANPLGKALHSCDAVMAADLLTFMSCMHNTIPNDTMWKMIMELNMYGPRLDNICYPDVHKMNVTVQYMKHIFTKPTVIDRCCTYIDHQYEKMKQMNSNKSQSISSSTSFSYVEEFGKQMLSNYYMIDTVTMERQRCTKTSYERIFTSIHAKVCFAEIFIDLLQHQLQTITFNTNSGKGGSINDTMDIDYHALPIIRDMLHGRRGVKDVLETMMKACASTWIQYGIPFLFNIETMEWDTINDTKFDMSVIVNKIQHEVRQLTKLFGIGISYVSWLYSKELNEGPFALAHLMGQIFDREIELLTTGTNSNDDDDTLKVYKTIKLHFIASIDKNIIPQLRPKLAERFNVAGVYNILYG